MQASKEERQGLAAQLSASSQAAEAATRSLTSLQEQHADAQDRLAQHEAAAAAAAQELDVLKVRHWHLQCTHWLLLQQL